MADRQITISVPESTCGKCGATADREVREVMPRPDGSWNVGTLPHPKGWHIIGDALVCDGCLQGFMGSAASPGGQ